MIANIFYPIFTLTITVLACFMRGKLFGFLHPRLHQGIALNPLGGLQPLPDPQLQSFLAWPKTDVPIFFLHYPLTLKTIYIHTFTKGRKWNWVSNFQAENSCVHKQLEPEIKNGVAYKKIVLIRKPMFNLSLTFLLFWHLYAWF